jgi:hypothetical protein
MKSPKTRIHNFSNDLLMDALSGLVKRFGPGVVEEKDGPCLRRVVEQNIKKDRVEINYFWAAEILKEFHHRRGAGSISWPPTGALSCEPKREH